MTSPNASRQDVAEYLKELFESPADNDYIEFVCRSLPLEEVKAYARYARRLDEKGKIRTSPIIVFTVLCERWRKSNGKVAR